MARYSFRLMRLHASAAIKEAMVPVRPLLSLAEGLGGGPVALNGDRKDAARGAGASAQPAARRGTSLPSWFERRPGRRYQVFSSEGPIESIKHLARVSQDAKIPLGVDMLGKAAR